MLFCLNGEVQSSESRHVSTFKTADLKTCYSTRLNDSDHTGTAVCPITLVHTDLGVAPLCDALPAKQVSTGGGGGVPPLL